MLNIKRKIQKNIELNLFNNKVIIIYGARQVGKTTLVKMIMQNYEGNSIFLNCDEIDVRTALTDKTSSELRAFVGDNKLVIIDEAQRVKNIGLTLKLLVDNYPEVQIIATGSSSFDLLSEIKEPLTGRKYEFELFPFSFNELKQVQDDVEVSRLLEHRIIYGMYPEIVSSLGKEKENLRLISSSYLYKDILAYQKIRHPEVLDKLLQALALQIGGEVSYTELANIVGVDKVTIASYIQILEKAFIVFRLGPFSRNLRNELKKMRKIYFFDNGIRNAILNNFSELSQRNDVGALWENFMISERYKMLSNNKIVKNKYFWRTHQQQEIDYLEEADGLLIGFEFKWKSKKYKKPELFLNTYKGSSIEIVTRDNFEFFLDSGAIA